MTTLIRPDNGQRAEFIAARNGYICLRTSCITPAVRWYSEVAIQAANPVQGCAMPPRAIVLYVSPDMIGVPAIPRKQKAVPGIDVAMSSGVVIKVKAA